MAPEGSEQSVEALRCLDAWVRIEGDDGQSALTGVAQMRKELPALVNRVLQGMASSRSEEVEAAGEALECILVRGQGIGSQGDQEARAHILQALTAQAPAALASEEAAFAVVRVAAAIAATVPTLVATAPAADMANLVLQLVGRFSDKRVTESCLDYFTSLNDVPRAQRAAPLQVEVYATLLMRLESCLQYEADFSSWEAAAEDADAFFGFRDQVLGDALEMLFHLLQLDYLAFWLQKLQASGSWQAAEAAVFAVRKVALPVRQQLFPDRKKAPQAEAEPLQAARGGGSGFAESANATLQAFLTLAASGQGWLGSQPEAVVEVCHLLGDYSTWFSKHPDPPLEPAMAYLLRALALPPAFPVAADAFAKLCARCHRTLCHPASLGRLIESAELGMGAAFRATLASWQQQPPSPAGSHSPPSAAAASPTAWTAPGTPGASPSEQQLAALQQGAEKLVQGLSRLAAGLPDPEQLQLAVQRIAAPMQSRAQAVLAEAGAGPVAPALAQQLAMELGLLGVLARFLHRPQPSAGGGIAHPALQVLEMSRPLLSAVGDAAPWLVHEPVVVAAAELCRCVSSAAQADCLPLLPSLLTLVNQLFSSHPHSACLEVVSVVAEHASAAGTDEAWRLLGEELAWLGKACAGLMQGASDGRRADILAALFHLADRLLVFRPATVFESAMLPTLLEWACQCLRHHRETDVVREALAVLKHLVAPVEAAPMRALPPPLQAELNGAVAAQAEEVATALMHAAADSCPAQLLGRVAACLRPLLSGQHRAAAAKALWWALTNDASGLAQRAALSEDDALRFANLACREPPLEPRRFELLCTDFARVLRGEEVPDALLGHELQS